MESKSNDFRNLLVLSLKKLESGMSPTKVLGEFSHSLTHYMDSSRNIELLDTYLYVSFFSGRLIKDYFLLKVRPLILDGVAKSNLSNFLKESLTSELTEMREQYFDEDFVPNFSEMQDKLTTLRNVVEISGLSNERQTVLSVVDTLYSVISTASKEIKLMIGSAITSIFKDSIASSPSEVIFRTRFKELVTKSFMEVSGW